MSGRALRRLPVLALAKYIGLTANSIRKVSGAVNNKTQKSDCNYRSDLRHAPGTKVSVWLDAMSKVISDQAVAHEKFV